MQRCLTRLAFAGLAAGASLVLTPPSLPAEASTLEAQSQTDREDDDVRVVDVNDKVFGKTYQEWSAAWWQWVFRTPSRPGGPFDSGTIDCADRQPNRQVLFLTGPFNESGSVKRTCEDPVPRDTYIFFPLINVECSDLEGDGDTPKERRSCVKQPLFNPADLHAQDKHFDEGERDLTDLKHFEVISPDFPFTAKRGNPTGVVGEGNSTSRGNWVMLKPLPAGEHEISFGGSYPKIPFTVDVEYKLTVEGG